MHQTTYRVALFVVAIVSTASATVTTGTVTLDGNTIHYQAFSGTSATDFQQFLAGATLIDFENISGITPLTVNAYTSGTPTTAANLTNPTQSVSVLFCQQAVRRPVIRLMEVRLRR